MKYCEKCGKQLSDEACFCSGCGCSTADKKKKFCTKCGSEIESEAIICPACGCPTELYGAQFANAGGIGYAPNNAAPQGFAGVDAGPYLRNLSQKIQTEAIIWGVIAVIQIILGIYLLSIYNPFSDYEETYGTTLLVIAALNIFSAYSDFKYSKEVLARPSNILSKYTPVTGLVISLVYNVIFGGLIGVAGSIFGFVTRNYVMTNAPVFSQFEKKNII